MAQVLQLRRGTTAQNDAFTGAVAEVSVDTDRDSLRVHDGVTMGGKEIADLQTAVPLLPAASSVSGSDTVPVIQSGVARRATKTQILNGIVDANIDAAADISGTKLANNAVTTAKIADSNVTTAKIADSNVTTVKIADSNVTTAKIADSNVTTAKIADSNVTTAKIADSNVTTAKIADSSSTTTGVTNAKLRQSAALSVIGRSADTTGAPADIAAANDGEVMRRSGTAIGFGQVATAGLANAAVTPAKLSQPYTLATAVASTSGTSINFTGIPSWAKRITVMFSGVSTSGTSIIQVQLGDSGGVENTGYVAGASSAGSAVIASTSFTTGFGIRTSNTAAATYQGSLVITNLSSNTWIANGCMYSNSDYFSAPFGGSKTLSDTLDRVRITTVNGTDTFDAGSINISYEG